ncbi:MAG: LexA family transcriptional regulator [Elusimicrobia bacterium]|nr:LexA family transcriptional regulator [Elusimicrobiota bacterium]
MTFNDLLRKWNGGILKGAQTKLAAKAEVDRGTVSRWATGTLMPGEDMRMRLSKILDISIDELMDCLKQGHRKYYPGIKSDVSLLPMETSRIPIVGVVSADRFRMSFEVTPDEYLPFLAVQPGTVFALRVRNDCMEPAIKHGDIVVVRKQEWANSEDVVVAQLDGEFTMKRYFPLEKHIELRPDNKKHGCIPIKDPENFHIVGVVIGKFQKFI